MINGKTNTYGIVGYPVGHSFSPMIHNYLADEIDINMVYIPLPIENKRFEMAIKALKTLSFSGCNVTVPYKMDVIGQLDVVDKNAELIGAVNTVKILDDKSYGYNTDYLGLIQSIKDEGVSLEGQNVIIIGAGGAARSVAVMCATEHAKSISIVNRTLVKAESIATLINEHFDCKVSAITYEDLNMKNDFTVAIQTTSIGMYPNVDNTPIVDMSILSKLDFAIDIVYNPRETKFMRDLNQMGVKTIGGIGMLFYQAIKAFEIWNDVTVDGELCQRAYERFLEYLDQ